MKTSSIIKRTIMIILILALVLSSAGCSCTGRGADEETSSQTEETAQKETSDPTEEKTEPAAVYETKDKTATYELDADKTLFLDKDTRTELFQTDKEMVIELIEGQILLDVRRKLSEDESLIIRTSGVDVNIRGTIVFANNQPAQNVPNTRTVQVGVLEGTTTASYVQANGTPQMMVLSAGQMVALNEENGIAQTNAVVQPLAEEDIRGFIAETINADANLGGRIILGGNSSSGDDISFSANGEWTYDEPVMLVAQSASKLYDGTPLTRAGGVQVIGLPSFFSIQASASGSQTDAGQTVNAVSTFRIYNKNGEDVTSHFTKIQTIDGTLKVDPAPLTIWTASSTKEYDGTPLTNKNAGFRTTSNYEKDGPVWQNTAVSLPTDIGTQVLYGICGTTWVYGTNPITGETKAIELQTGQSLTIELNSTGGADSIEFQIDNLSEEDLPAEILRIYAENPDLLAKAAAQIGWDIETLNARIAELPESTDRTTAKGGLSVDSSITSGLIFDTVSAYMTIDTQMTDYNARGLSGDEVRFCPVNVDSSITIKTTGSQTEVGESVNTYEIDWGNVNPSNYILSEELGKLTVTQRSARTVSSEVKFTAGSGSKVFDGTPLGVSDVTVTGLPEGFTWTAACSGSQTDVGSSANIISEYHILDAGGVDVTRYFTNVKTASGSLTVEPLKVEVSWSQELKRYYNGETCGKEAGEFTLTYLNGEHAGETGEATVSITENGNEYLFYLFTSDQISAVGSGSGKDAGTYEIAVSASVAKGAAANYMITTSKGSLVISPVPLIVVTDSASKEKDGQALTAGLTVYRTAGGNRIKASDATGKVAVVSNEILTFTATGSQTEEGQSNNTYSVSWGSANEKNYVLTDELGTLTVATSSSTAPDKPDEQVESQKEELTAAITITAGSAEKVYDGKPLNAEASVVGLPTNYTINVTCSSLTDAGIIDNVVSEYKIFDANGKDVTEFMTNVTIVKGQLTVKPAPLTITTGSAEKVYDGTALTCGTASISGLVNGETATVTATGSVTNAGTTPTTNTYSITWGTAKESNYEITESLGSLMVSPLKLNFTWATVEESYPYDGFVMNAANGTMTLTYMNGAHAGETIICEEPELINEEAAVDETQEIWQYSFTLFTGDKVYINACGGGKTTGTHTVSLAATEVTAENKNFDITCTDGKIVIVGEKTLTITTGDAFEFSDLWDRTTALTNDSVTVEGLAPGDEEQVVVTATGSLDHVGEAANTYEINWGTADPNYYTIVENLGTLAIKKYRLTIETETTGKVYDTRPLVGRGVELKLEDGTTTYTDDDSILDSVDIQGTGEITDIGSVDNPYKVNDWGDLDPSDVYVVEKRGTLTVFSSFEEVNLKINEEEMKICFHYDPTTPDSEQTFYQLKNDNLQEVKATLNVYLQIYYNESDRGNKILAGFLSKGWVY